MSEQIPNTPTEAEAASHGIMDFYRRSPLATGMALGAVMIGGAIAYFGKENNPVTEHFGVQEASAQTLNQANKVCGVDAEFDVNSASQPANVPSPEAFFPALTTQKNGQETLLSEQTMKDRVKEQLVGDTRVLAVFKAFFIDTRDKVQLPNAGTLDRSHELVDLYAHNKEAAAQDLKEACEVVDDMVVNKNFGVPRGQGMQIKAIRNGNTLEGFSAQTVNTTEGVSVLQMNINTDSSDYTPEQKDILRTLQSVLGIDLEHSNIIAKLVFGPGSFKISENQQAAPVHPTKGNHVVKVKFHKGGKVEVLAQPQHQTNGGSQHQQQQQRGGGGSGGDTHGKSPEKNAGQNPGGKSPNRHPGQHGSHPGPESTPNTGGNNAGPSPEKQPGQNGGGQTPPPTETTPPQPTPTTPTPTTPTPTTPTPTTPTTPELPPKDPPAPLPPPPSGY